MKPKKLAFNMDKANYASAIASQIGRNIKSIKFGYLFGSHAQGTAGPRSDFDFAFFSDLQSRKKLFELKLDLQTKLSMKLKTDRVDVVMLNLVSSTELKYDIIKNGKLLFEREHYRLVVEPQILTEYFDFRSMLRRHNLTST